MDDRIVMTKDEEANKSPTTDDEATTPTSPSSSSMLLDSHSSIVPSKRHNVLVAQSDYDAAIQALQFHVQQQQEHVRASTVRVVAGPTATTTLDNEVVDPPEEQDVTALQIQLLQDCSQSLTNHIARICQPIPDDVYHQHIQQYGCLDDCVPPKEEDDHTKEDTVDLDDDFDTNELLDQDAMQRLSELRAEVQAKASRINTLRKSVMEQATQYLNMSRPIMDINGVPNDGNNNNNNYSSHISDSSEVVELKSNMMVMRQTLQELELKFERTEEQLAHELEQLQQTVSVVEKSRAASKTTTATTKLDRIMQMDFSVASLLDDVNENNHTNVENMHPEERLLQLLQRR